MPSKVYFIDFKASFSRDIFQKFEDLFNQAGLSNLFKPKELVACKLHFGDRGNITYIKPIFIKKIVELIKAKEGIPFLTDTTTLYVGARSSAPSHIELAKEHGFSGTPIIIANGLRGADGVKVKVNLKHFKEVKIASSIHYADAMVVVSHFKGHMETGFGGALKNLGMGCSTKEGKLEMHSGLSPAVSTKKCKGCGSCVKWCPADAIHPIQNNKNSYRGNRVLNLKGVSPLRLKIIESKCIGCGTCIAVCPEGAIKIRWKEDTIKLQETIVEHAKGTVMNKPVGYINFLTDITKLCDCAPTIELPILPDIGILASIDPVAIDRASFDLVNQTSGGKFGKIWPNSKPEVQLQYAEQIGLGTQEYELLKID